MSYPSGTGFERHPDGVVVTVWVVARSKRPGIDGVHDGAIRVRVAAPPEGGRANREVARTLKGQFGAKKVRLLLGATSRRKRFLVVGVTPVEVAAALGL